MSIPRPAASAAERIVLGGFWFLLLAMAWVQFSGIWYFPPMSGFTEQLSYAQEGRPLAVPFQNLLWAMIVGGAILAAMSRGPENLIGRLLVFLPLGLLAAVSGVLGHDLGASRRLIMLWLLCLVAGATLGTMVPFDRLRRWLSILLFFTLAAAVTLALVLPEYGQMHTALGTVWRGLNSNKNAFGFLTAVILVVTGALPAEGRTRIERATLVLAVVCLWRSGSMGALLAALGVLGWIRLSTVLSRRVRPGLLLTGVLVVVLAALLVALPLVSTLLQSLGRDVTLTGRTVIWPIYLESMMQSPVFGAGPGAYTGPSPLTLPLAERLTDWGAILTPHSFYLGALGDLGLPTALLLVGFLLYCAVWLPRKQTGPAIGVLSALALLYLLNGVVETQVVIGPGIFWFLLALFWSLRQSLARVIHE